MAVATLPERVAARSLPSVDPAVVARVLFTVLAAPFFAVGWLVGAFLTAVLWVCAAVAEGYDTGRARRGDRS